MQYRNIGYKTGMAMAMQLPLAVIKFGAEAGPVVELHSHTATDQLLEALLEKVLSSSKPREATSLHTGQKATAKSEQQKKAQEVLKLPPEFDISDEADTQELIQQLQTANHKQDEEAMTAPDGLKKMGTDSPLIFDDSHEGTKLPEGECSVSLDEFYGDPQVQKMPKTDLDQIHRPAQLEDLKLQVHQLEKLAGNHELAYEGVQELLTVLQEEMKMKVDMASFGAMQSQLDEMKLHMDDVLDNSKAALAKACDRMNSNTRQLNKVKQQDLNKLEEKLQEQHEQLEVQLNEEITVMLKTVKMQMLDFLHSNNKMEKKQEQQHEKIEGQLDEKLDEAVVRQKGLEVGRAKPFKGKGVDA